MVIKKIDSSRCALRFLPLPGVFNTLDWFTGTREATTVISLRNESDKKRRRERGEIQTRRSAAIRAEREGRPAFRPLRLQVEPLTWIIVELYTNQINPMSS